MREQFYVSVVTDKCTLLIARKLAKQLQKAIDKGMKNGIVIIWIRNIQR